MGVGIGVPLGIAIIGLFGSLFWRETMRQRQFNSRILSQKSVHENVGQFAPMFTVELPDAQLPREMDGLGRVELSNN